MLRISSLSLIFTLKGYPFHINLVSEYGLGRKLASHFGKI